MMKVTVVRRPLLPVNSPETCNFGRWLCSFKNSTTFSPLHDIPLFLLLISKDVCVCVFFVLAFNFFIPRFSQLH